MGKVSTGKNGGKRKVKLFLPQGTKSNQMDSPILVSQFEITCRNFHCIA